MGFKMRNQYLFFGVLTNQKIQHSWVFITYQVFIVTQEAALPHIHWTFPQAT